MGIEERESCVIGIFIFVLAVFRGSDARCFDFDRFANEIIACAQETNGIPRWILRKDWKEKKRSEDKTYWIGELSILRERKRNAGRAFDQNVAASEHNNSSRRDVSFSNLRSIYDRRK